MLFATTNKNKLSEEERILGVSVESVQLDIDEIQTLDPEECAKKKALSAYLILGKPVLIEDTTLFFEAWNGLPWVFIDYFMNTLGKERLLKLLTDESNRQAYAQTTLAISLDGKQALTFTGRVDGSISSQIKGDNNLGWDPIFIPQGSDKTFAEMTGEEKDAYSIRDIAFTEYKKAGII